MKVIYLEGNTPEYFVPGVGVVEGTTFQEFVDDIRELNEDPHCTAIAIPHELDFKIPDTVNYATQEQHRAFTRLDIVAWYFKDENFTKPLYLHDATTLEEIRTLSSIFGVVAIFLFDNPTSYDDAFMVAAAAGDQNEIEKIMREMAEEGSEFSWVS